MMPHILFIHINIQLFDIIPNAIIFVTLWYLLYRTKIMRCRSQGILCQWYTYIIVVVSVVVFTGCCDLCIYVSSHIMAYISNSNIHIVNCCSGLLHTAAGPRSVVYYFLVFVTTFDMSQRYQTTCTGHYHIRFPSVFVGVLSTVAIPRKISVGNKDRA